MQEQQQQQKQQRLQCSFPAVKAARPVRHPHCATCACAACRRRRLPVQHHVAAAAAQVASRFEFELVGILQRATHSLTPLALPRGATALHFTVFSYALSTFPLAPLPCFAFIFFATFFLAFVHLPATVSMACKQHCAGQQRQVGVAAT